MKLLRISSAAAAAAVLLWMGSAAAAQMLPLLQNTRPDFTAVSQAQLETLHYLAHIFLKQQGEYPQSLRELRDSPYWVVEVCNFYTGLPIAQIPFVPKAEDYEYAPLPPAGAFPPTTGEGSEEGAEAEQAPGATEIAPASRRIDPRRVQFPSPGDLLYFTEGNALQLVIFDDSGSWQELWVEQPFNYHAASLRIAESARPQSDFLVAELAVHLERMLPGMYNRKLFLTDEKTFSPTELARLLPLSFERMAAELSLIYINPVKKRAFMRADYYSPGDLGTAAWLGEETMVYFLEAKRARTLLELTDQDVRREHSQAIARRDKLVARHANEVPPQPE